MPLYEDRTNAENYANLPEYEADRIIGNTVGVIDFIIKGISTSSSGTPVYTVLDGWYGIDWPSITKALEKEAKKLNLNLKIKSSHELYQSQKKLGEIKQPYITDDPSFGYANLEGDIESLLDDGKVAAFAKEKNKYMNDGSAVILYGPGAGANNLGNSADQVYFFDKTRQPLLWQMWDGKLVPFGTDTPNPDYDWKEYYYFDFYALHNHKKKLVESMNFWVEGIEFDTLKLVPKKVYDSILKILVTQPVKEVKIFQPGPWGAFRYKDLWEIPGLECNAWNELAGPELSILVKVNGNELLNMPAMNLMQYPEQFVGPWLNENFPDLFPLDVWLDDGYFPKPEPAERISMPIHNHPSTDYVKKHFKEPLGRYETYYITEAYKGANTWLGYNNNVDLEEWERKCRKSENLSEITDWKDYIANWESAEGDLYLIPPGTVHGHGGNQMVLEMDTCPSIAGTEYSFFEYDFARNSWDDDKKSMNAKPMKMHLDHGFNNEKWRRESWVKDNLLARPEAVYWDKNFTKERFSSLEVMPFEIERFHFTKMARENTEGRFMHIVTLTIGERVTIRSISDPAIEIVINWYQSAIIPACFGEYEIENLSGGRATVVLLRWKKG